MTRTRHLKCDECGIESERCASEDAQRVATALWQWGDTRVCGWCLQAPLLAVAMPHVPVATLDTAKDQR